MKMGLSEAEQMMDCIEQSNANNLFWKSLVFGKRKALLTQKAVMFFVKTLVISMIGS